MNKQIESPDRWNVDNRDPMAILLGVVALGLIAVVAAILWA